MQHRPLALGRLMSFSLASFVPSGASATSIGPFPQAHVHIHLSPHFNRITPHPDPTIDTTIEELWQEHTRRAPRLFNGTKFRLHDWHIDTATRNLELQCGMTDYKSYLGTCVSTLVTQLRDDGVRLANGNATAFLSRKIGVSGVVETTDHRVALIERSRSVGVYQQLFDTPGGHPEPADLPFTIEDLATLQEGSEQATAVEAQVVARLFGSIVDEVHEEINLAPTLLTEPLLLGVVFQSEAETPSFVFHMATSLTSTDVDALYKLGPQDKFESTRLVWVDQATLDKFQLTPAAQGSLALWKQYCAFRANK